MKQLKCSSELWLQDSVYGHYVIPDNVSHFSSCNREKSSSLQLERENVEYSRAAALSTFQQQLGKKILAATIYSEDKALNTFA